MNKPWQEYARQFKELFELDCEPVGCAVIEQYQGGLRRKARLCKAIVEAAGGKEIYLSRDNNACFGAAWHLGFCPSDDERSKEAARAFVVEGEKLFASYEALDTLMSQMPETPDFSRSAFMLAPLATITHEPALALFLVTPAVACRLLALATFKSGRMPLIKIGGPTCKLSVIYPLISGEVNISFYDCTSRKLAKLPADKLLVSIPVTLLADMAESIDGCSGGRATVEFSRALRKSFKKR